MALNNDDKIWIKDTIVEVLEAVVLPRFGEIDERFDGVDKRLDGIDQRLDNHDQRFDGIEDQLRSLTAAQYEMREWIESVDRRLLGVESDIKEIYDRIVALEKTYEARGLRKDEQAELKERLDALTKWAQNVSKATGVPLPKL